MNIKVLPGLHPGSTQPSERSVVPPINTKSIKKPTDKLWSEIIAQKTDSPLSAKIQRNRAFSMKPKVQPAHSKKEFRQSIYRKKFMDQKQQSPRLCLDLTILIPKLRNYYNRQKEEYDHWKTLLKEDKTQQFKELSLKQEFLYEQPYIKKSMEAMEYFIRKNDFNTIELLKENEYIVQPAYVLSLIYNALLVKGEVEFNSSLIHELINRELITEKILIQDEIDDSKVSERINMYLYPYCMGLALLGQNDLLWTFYEKFNIIKNFFDKCEQPPESDKLLRTKYFLDYCMLETLNLREERFAEQFLNLVVLSHPKRRLNQEFVDKAIECSCIDFLKKIKKNKYVIDETDFGKAAISICDSKKNLKIGYLLFRFFKLGKTREAMKILKWKWSLSEQGLVIICAKQNEPVVGEKIVDAIVKSGRIQNLGPDDLMHAIINSHYELALYKEIAKINHTRTALRENRVQEKILTKMIEGRNFYYCAELLTLIGAKYWNHSNTIKFCYNIRKISNDKEILKCHSPFLSCILMAEFCTIIQNVQYQSYLESAMTSMIDLSKFLQKSCKTEKQFRFLMSASDFRGRRVLEIIAGCNFYGLLEPDDVGIIAENMWKGAASLNLFECSFLHKFVTEASSIGEGLKQDRMDIDKRHYCFQYSSWIKSSQIRYITEGLFALILAVFYMTLMYNCAEDDSFHTLTEGASRFGFFKISTDIIIAMQFLYELVFLFFMIQTNRSTGVNKKYILATLLLVLTIIFNTNLLKKIFVNSKDNDDVFSNHIAAVILPCFVIGIIWIQVTQYLRAIKEIGHIIQTIILILIRVMNFMILFSCWLICWASLFTALFSETNPDYKDFVTSITTLLAASLGVFANNFSEYSFLGNSMLSTYVLISLVMLVNLLIALLTNIYGEVARRIDANHRQFLITYHHIYEWNSEYGFLIFMPPPLNIITLVSAPILLNLRNKKKASELLCRACFLFFCLPMFLIFFSYNCLLLPFAWIKGFLILKMPSEFKEKSIGWKILIYIGLYVGWITGGFLVGFMMLCIDSYDYFKIVVLSISLKRFEEEEQNQQRKEHELSSFGEELSCIANNVDGEFVTLDDMFNIFLNAMQTTKAFLDYKYEVKYYNKLYKSPLETEFQFVNRLKDVFSSCNKIKRRHENIINIKRNLRKLLVIENFLADDLPEIGKIVNAQLLRFYFPDKFRYPPNFFKRGYYFNSPNLKRALNKFKSKRELATDDQVMIKLSEKMAKTHEDILAKIQLLIEEDEDLIDSFNEKEILQKSRKIFSTFQSKEDVILEANEINEMENLVNNK